MRTVGDRLRHAICFEVIGVILVSPLSSWLFDTQIYKIGALAIAMSLIATTWNYIYNVWFDRAMLKLKGRVLKNAKERIVHAGLFELGMLMFTLPPTLLWMGYSFEKALRLDLVLMVFYLIYTYIYNWIYDMVFPIPESSNNEPNASNA